MYEFFKIVDELHDDPTLFPVLSAPQQPLPFELEPADGEARFAFESRNISVAQRTTAGWTELRTFRDLKFGVVITDARIVVYCEKWTKGGGWRGFGVGGLAFAAAANAVSHARAAHRRKGKLLAAQIRYGWLAQAGAVVDRRGRPVAIRLAVNAGTRAEQRLLAMDIPIGSSDPAALAADISTAAARHRLRTGRSLVEPDYQICERLAQDARPHGVNGVWLLPGAIPVGAVGSMPAEAAGAPGVTHDPPALPTDPRLTLPPPVIAPSSTMTVPRPAGGCPACGHVARLTAATCPRCGMARAEPVSVAAGNIRPPSEPGR
jgi:hypothetical protein